MFYIEIPSFERYEGGDVTYVDIFTMYYCSINYVLCLFYFFIKVLCYSISLLRSLLLVTLCCIVATGDTTLPIRICIWIDNIKI